MSTSTTTPALCSPVPVTLRSVSYGGGRQSTALLVLAAQQRIDFPLFVFANVGDKSENPETLRYVDRYARPYADAHGIELVTVQKQRRGRPDDIYERLTDPDAAFTGIPWRSSYLGPPMSRSCTVSWKKRVIGAELRRRGASPETPATVGVGFALEEVDRANTRKAEPYERLVYPLVGIGEETGLRMRTADCIALITSAGLPVPPKSACWFCPHHSTATWAELRRTHPDRFEAAAQLEDTMRARNEARGLGPVYLSRTAIPLRGAVDDGQPALFEDADCETGVCFT